VLQELAARTDAVHWVIASMLFFIGIWIGVLVTTFRARPEEMESRARLPLDEEDPDEIEPPPASGRLG